MGDKFQEIKQLDLESIVVPVLNKSGLDGDRLQKEWKWLIQEIERLHTVEQAYQALLSATAGQSK